MTRTLVIRLGALGDAVLTLPALAHLVAKGERVTVLGVRASWNFLPPRGAIEIEDVEFAWWRTLFAGDCPDEIRAFDRVVVMLGKPDTAEVIARAGIAATHVPPIKPGERGEHAAQRLLAGIGGTEIDAGAVRALIVPEIGGVRHDLVVHPGSGGKPKRWAADRFADLARRATSPLVLLGPAENDLASHFEGLPVAKDWPLRKVVATLAAARAFVGNDSGVSHLASYLCPTLALFGPTDPKVWAPAGPFAEVIATGDLARLATEEVASRLI